MTGPGFLPTFLYYCAGTTVIVAFVLAKGLDSSASIRELYQIGLLVGIGVGGFGAYLNSHREIELPIKNRGAFLAQLNRTLTDLGYVEQAELDGIKVYQRPFPSNIFSGKLFIQLAPKQAAIAGRASQVRRMQKRLLAAAPEATP